ncbi:MAG: two-component system response regulator [Crocinitomicaceae bacterium]|nr:two-component system response regulator [Crocinitomicaceae bacterium]|tara:strand:+ start:9831 stop:10325 length:495 start_codon:yes stop_codon:yes gene_type:complete
METPKIEPSFSELPLVLYVDDEEHNLNAFYAAFRRRFKITRAVSAKAALEIIEKQEVPFEVIISDQRMPEMTGVELLEIVKSKSPESIRMLLTGFADINAVVDCINRGEVYRYLTKPWDEANLNRTILDAVELFRLRFKNEWKTQQLIKMNGKLEFLARQGLIS